MAFISVPLPDDLREAFKARLLESEGESQARFLRKCAKAYVDGTLWFEGRTPRTSVAPDETPESYLKRVRTPPPALPALKPEITSEQYAQVVDMCRMNKLNTSDKLHYKDIMKYALEKFDCNDIQLRKFLLEYPPDYPHPRAAMTDKFVEGVLNEQ
jgi:hypothetical protein